ncbi:MAG TPA: hypothetical protein VGC93_01510 [Thermoanaerobaculia bacterium]
MARQNFQHSKRQRDLAKKQKREEKQQRKAERKRLGQQPEGAPPAPEAEAAPVEPQNPS